MTGYTKQTWLDYNPAYPLSATRLGVIEDALYDAKRRMLNVKDYGAIGNGTTDDTTSIQAAITAAGSQGGGIVYLPPTNYKITQPLTFTSDKVTLKGDGHGFPKAGGSQDAASTLTWGGGATSAAKMITATTVNAVRFEDLMLDCNRAAVRGIEFTDVSYSRIRNVTVINGQRNGNSGGTIDSIALNLVGSAVGCSFNSFENLYLQGGTMLKLDGVGALDCTLNTFRFIYGGFGSASGTPTGIILGVCDANSFFHTYCYRDSGTTAFSLSIGTSARKNTFWYLHPDTGNSVTVAAPADAAYRNAIMFLDRGDGADFPTIAATANLTFTDDGAGTQAGWFLSNRVVTPVSTMAYSASVTPSLRSGGTHLVTVTNGTAFTITNPVGLNELGSTWTHDLLIEIRNTSGGAMGAITWAAGYVLLGGAFTNPADGKRRWIRFAYLPSGFVEIARAPADYT